MEAGEHSNRARVVYFSHGGGPLPILGDPGHQAMIDFMRDLSSKLPVPEAILVISAHWEAGQATLLGNPSPSMLYDYYGFPEEAYDVDYPAPGNPKLAGDIAGLLREAGIPSEVDSQRGFDHGVFIPLMMMYPEAGIPVTQLSLLRGLDPEAHLALGRALKPLLDQNILVIGSGFSFHNLREFFSQRGGTDERNGAFQDWLKETCTADLSPEERQGRLRSWQDAPHARYCHQREEHLLPLHVCCGMTGGEAGTVIFDDSIMGKRAVALLW